MALPSPAIAESVAGTSESDPVTGETPAATAVDAGEFQVTWNYSASFTYDVLYQRVGSATEYTVTNQTSPAVVQPSDWTALDDNVQYDVWIRTTFNSSQVVTNKARVTLNKAADGGTVTTFTGDGANGTNGVVYRVHTFAADGTFTLAYPRDVEYLIVGGGGGGGARHGGGGGAGGVRSGTSSAQAAGSYPVAVGSGGAGKAAWTLSGATTSLASSGGSSSALGVTAAGGGRGGSGGGGGASESGGSGGGSQSGTGASGNTPSTTPAQGFAGGNGSNSTWSGGGGGGAGAVGGNSVPTGDVSGGHGGTGVASSITGTSITYAGGGGGAMETIATGTAGRGGTGGGGAGGHLGWEMFNNRGVLRWEIYNTGTDDHPSSSASFDSMLTSGRLTASGFVSIGTSDRTRGGSASGTLLDWDGYSQLAAVTGATIPNSGDNFALVVQGVFWPPESSTYTFELESDDSADVRIDNTNVVSYYGGRGLGSVSSGSMSLTSGNFYSFRVRMHEKGGGEGLRLFWRTTGNATYRQQSGSLGAASPMTTAEMNSLMSAVSGSRTSYGTAAITTQTGSSTANILNWTDPDAVTGATAPNSTHDFSYVVKGTFVPSETGTYTFTVSGDDAVDVSIGGTVVASHYGDHGMSSLGTNSGTISLTRGQAYHFRARLQEGFGGEGLRVFWRKPSQSGSGSWYQDSSELSAAGRDGTDGLGGGGGAGGHADNVSNAGGRGGNGVVVLRYPARV